MLLEFKFGNYLSFKEIVTLSMIPTAIKEHEETNLYHDGKINVLKSAVLYGANASGKSNFLSALSIMKKLVLRSHLEDDSLNIISHFRFSTESDHKPTVFEVTFAHDNTIYRYGFEVSEEIILSEWLFFVPNNREAKLFVRDEESISYGTYFKEARGAFEVTRDNSLFLSSAARFKGSVHCGNVVSWFKNLTVLGDNLAQGMRASIERLGSEYKQELIDFIRCADLGITDMYLEDDGSESTPNLSPSEQDTTLGEFGRYFRSLHALRSVHPKFNEDYQVVGMESLHVEGLESEGTKKLFAMASLILDTLKKGGVLVVDEIDSKLHPVLVSFIVGLFNSKQNRIGQLIVASHAVYLLTPKLFRRDQIWFAEKDRYGCTNIYSLVEYQAETRKVRKDENYEKNYIQGRYGAIPLIGDWEELHGNRQPLSQEESSATKESDVWF